MEMSNLCANCKHKTTCTRLCPEALKYVNQDYVPPTHIKLDPMDHDLFQQEWRGSYERNKKGGVS